MTFRLSDTINTVPRTRGVLARGTRMGVAAVSLAFGAASAQAQVSVEFPLGLGLHVPSYDRVNGLSLPFGPSVTIGDSRVVIEPTVTYRSHLGNLDPLLRASWNVTDSNLVLSVIGERGTFTNDKWIRSDLVNSLASLGAGDDSRNYYRADRAEGRLSYSIPVPAGIVQTFAGARFENAWSTGWRAGERRGPYSFFGRHNERNGIDRPNPLIDRGHVGSALVGVGGTFEKGPVRSDVHVHGEFAWHTPFDTPSGADFQQYTFNQEGRISTFGRQHLFLNLHGVTTSGGATPLQRYAYLGGAGTLATVDMLAMGGDRMYFLDAAYVIPVPIVDLPLIGGPFIAPRYMIGAAGVREFGVPTTNVGVRVGFGPLCIDYLVDPRSHDHDFGVGLSFSR
jgi:hypothetical protein